MLVHPPRELGGRFQDVGDGPRETGPRLLGERVDLAEERLVLVLELLDRAEMPGRPGADEIEEPVRLLFVCEVGRDQQAELAQTLLLATSHSPGADSDAPGTRGARASRMSLATRAAAG